MKEVSIRLFVENIFPTSIYYIEVSDNITNNLICLTPIKENAAREMSNLLNIEICLFDEMKHT